MITVFDFEKLTKRVIDHYNSLLNIYKDEIKEYGSPKEDTIKEFNALYLQMNKAAEHLESGLLGCFPWEE